MARTGRKPTGMSSCSLALEELNLVEFPLVVLADRVSKEQKVLEFSDSIEDASSGEKIKRSVTVSADHLCGLPTAPDQDVLLALMKLTDAKHGFKERSVNFTLYEVCKLLKQSKGGDRYKRIAASLDRWLGTTIRFSHWRFNNEWVKKKQGFHIIDNYELTRKKNYEPDEPQMFIWNELVWKNFQSGHTRSLDWDFYLSLESSVAKRLYRFLGKRFFLRHEWKFDLAEFGWNKVGISRGCRVSKMQERLLPGILELEKKGFLREMDASSRFKKRSGKGCYDVFFKDAPRRVKPKRPEVMPMPMTESPLEAALLARGVTNAAKLVSVYDQERIALQVENFDDRVGQGGELSPGWLRKAIEENYGVRKGFKPKAEREAEAKRLKERKALKDRREIEEERKRTAKSDEKERAFRSFLNELGSEEARADFEQQALTKYSFYRRMIRKSDKEGTPERIRQYADMAMHTLWQEQTESKPHEAQAEKRNL